MSQDTVKFWMVKFGKPPLILQIPQGFLMQSDIISEMLSNYNDINKNSYKTHDGG